MKKGERERERERERGKENGRNTYKREDMWRREEGITNVLPRVIIGKIV